MFANLPSTGALVTLTDGTGTLVVAPACGARVVAYRVAGRDILRQATQEGLDNGFTYGFSAFPLMPYSGPIFGDGFYYGGAFHRLAGNVPAEPTATHGEGWISPWRILEQSDVSIRLGMDYKPQPDAFPFAWRGEIAYRLDRGHFAVEMRIENRDYREMPAGLGFHPYFPRVPGTMPCDYPYVCIEPVTNANDGINRAAAGVPGHSVADLAPGASLSGAITIGLR